MPASIVDCKPYVPAKNFAESQRFYEALRFTLTPGFGGTVDCRLGGMHFRLQDYFVPDWANNFMFAIGVPDVHAWYELAARLHATGAFPTMRIKPVEVASDGSLITHVVDPAGVLLVFIQRRADPAQALDTSSGSR